MGAFYRRIEYTSTSNMYEYMIIFKGQIRPDNRYRTNLR